MTTSLSLRPASSNTCLFTLVYAQNMKFKNPGMLTHIGIQRGEKLRMLLENTMATTMSQRGLSTKSVISGKQVLSKYTHTI